MRRSGGPTRHLGGVDDALLEHVAVLARRASKPSPTGMPLTAATMTEPSWPAFSAIWRMGASSARRRMARRSLVTLELELVERRDRLQQRGAAACDEALLDRRAGGRERVLDAVLLFLELDLSGRADLDHRHAAGQLGQPLLQLLAVVVGGGVLDLSLDLGHAALDRVSRAGAIDDGCVVLGRNDAAGASQSPRW